LQDYGLVNSLASRFGASSGGAGNLEALIAQRDALQARQRQAERLGQARELAQGIADLSDVRGSTFGDVASGLGVDLAALAADLGLGATSINDYLQSLQVDTADLAQIMLDMPERFARELFNVLAASNLSLTPVAPVTTPVIAPVGNAGNTPIGGSGTPPISINSPSPIIESLVQQMAAVNEKLALVVANTGSVAASSANMAIIANFGPAKGAKLGAL
jgi:hypothetical protein